MSTKYTFKEYTARMVSSRRYDKIVRKALELKAENARLREALEKASKKLEETEKRFIKLHVFDAYHIMQEALKGE